jgi:hypothetical protein
MSRFHAPARESVSPARFAHPAFAMLPAHANLLRGAWPAPTALTPHLPRQRHLYADVDVEFVEQDAALLADGLDYETRIARCGRIATRAGNWHDLFNALVWMTRFELKCALNVAYVRELAVAPPRMRTRAQCALTHFDEAGALVVLRAPGLLDAWDAHDWEALFADRRAQWGCGAELVLFGHALLEFLLVPEATPVAKCLVVAGAGTAAAAAATIATDIVAGRVLRDPQELRPLPLAGLPGWHEADGSREFLRSAPCFRPRREGRIYPPPRAFAGALSLATA